MTETDHRKGAMEMLPIADSVNYPNELAQLQRMNYLLEALVHAVLAAGPS